MNTAPGKSHAFCRAACLSAGADSAESAAGCAPRATFSPGASVAQRLNVIQSQTMKYLLGAMCLGLVLAGCGGGAKPAAQEGGNAPASSAGSPAAGEEDKVLNVYNWSDYI